MPAWPRSLAGPASGVLSTAQQVGGALGVAAVGVVFFTALEAAGGAAGAVDGARPGFATAVRWALAYEGAVFATALVLVLRLLRQPEQPPAGGPQPVQQDRPGRSQHRPQDGRQRTDDPDPALEGA